MGDKVKGKNLLILMAILVVGISIYTAVFSFFIQGNSGLISGAIRTAIEGLLIFFIFKGKRWAKIILIVLLTIAILGAIIGLTMSISAMLVVLILAYVASIYIIAFSSSVKEYLKAMN